MPDDNKAFSHLMPNNKRPKVSSNQHLAQNYMSKNLSTINTSQKYTLLLYVTPLIWLEKSHMKRTTATYKIIIKQYDPQTANHLFF